MTSLKIGPSRFSTSRWTWISALLGLWACAALSACAVDDPAASTGEHSLQANDDPSCVCPPVEARLPGDGKEEGGKGGGGDEGALCREGCERCWDGVCNNGETSANCPQDCGSPGWCGDGSCNGSESQWTCPTDCGSPPGWCGDGACNGSETQGSCPLDCAPPVCGDCFCGPGEWSSCPADCNLPPGTCA
jgi:hypothetical protein